MTELLFCVLKDFTLKGYKMNRGMVLSFGEFHDSPDNPIFVNGTIWITVFNRYGQSLSDPIHNILNKDSLFKKLKENKSCIQIQSLRQRIA